MSTWLIFERFDPETGEYDHDPKANQSPILFVDAPGKIAALEAASKALGGSGVQQMGTYQDWERVISASVNGEGRTLTAYKGRLHPTEGWTQPERESLWTGSPTR